MGKAGGQMVRNNTNIKREKCQLYSIFIHTYIYMYIYIYICMYIHIANNEVMRN